MSSRERKEAQFTQKMEKAIPAKKKAMVGKKKGKG